MTVALLAGVLLQAGCAGQAAVATRPRADSPPSSGPITTRDLVELKLISVVAVSPDQRSAVVRIDQQDIASASTLLTWRVIDLRSGAATGAFDAGAPLWNANHFIAGETPHWSPDSKWIYFRKLAGQGVQVWRARSDGTQASQVTRDPADVAGFEVREDGSLIFAVAGATRGEIIEAEAAEHDSGVLMSPLVIRGYPLAKSFPVNGRMSVYRHIESPRSGRRGTLLGDRPLRVMRLAPGDKAPVQLEDGEARAFLDARQLAPGFDFLSSIAIVEPSGLIDGDLVAFLQDVSAADGQDGPRPRSGQLVGWRRRPDGLPLNLCIDPLCLEPDVVQIVGWRPGRQELVFQTEERGVSRLVIWSTTTGETRKLWEAQGVIGSAESGVMGACQLAGDNAICIAAAADRPPRVISIDLATGHSRTLLDPNPDIPASRLGVASRIELSDQKGNSTLGIIVLPRNRPATSLPLVITSYSCRGFLQGGSGRDVPEHVLAALGYAVACVDLGSTAVRPAPGFAQTMSSTNLRALGFFENVVDVLQRDGIIDPDRVVLSGFSGSTGATAFALTRSSKFSAAIVTTGGSFDAGTCYFAANYRSCEAEAKRLGFGWPYDTRDGMLKDSPAWNADKISAPLLMQLPETEYTGMLQLYGALLGYGRAVEMYVFPGAYHYKHDPRQRKAVYDRNVDWINFWLKGIEPFGAEGEGTAMRWREMRERQCATIGNVSAAGPTLWYCRPDLQH